MKKTIDIIKALEATSSTNDKKDILTKAYESGERDFFVGMRLAYNKLISFGIKKIPYIEDEDDGFGELSFSDFTTLLNKLKDRELTGHAARDAIIEAAEKSNISMWNYFYRRILLRDMKIGVSTNLINTVLQQIGGDALLYQVPKFACQLAVDSQGHQKKLVGKKLIDVKLDGARMLVIMDKQENKVSMYSREGIEQFNFPNIKQKLTNLLPSLPQSLVLDGEILSDTFQNLMSQFQKKNANTDDMKLGLFDVIPMGDFFNGQSDIRQEDRHTVLAEMQTTGVLREHCDDTVYVIPKMMVDLDTEEGRKEMKEFFEQAVEAGFEGIMIKDPDAGYKGGKGSKWLKWKPKISVTLRVVDVIEGKAGSKYEGMVGKLVLEGVDEVEGKTITIHTHCGSGIDDNSRKIWWDDKSLIIDHLVEVEADSVSQSKNTKGDIYSLRFPRLKGVRGLKPFEKI